MAESDRIDLDELPFGSFIKAAIEARKKRARQFAERYPSLKGLPFDEFLRRYDLATGIFPDFITACETWEILNE